MFRRLLAVLAVALLAASCSASDTLATVNGEEITKADLYAMNPEYKNAPGSFTGENLREDVSGLVVLEATIQIAREQYGFELSESAIAERLTNPPARYASILAASGAPEDSIAQRNRAIVTLLLDAVAPELIAAEYGGFEGIFTDQPALVSKACIRHIAVATEEEANEVLARLDAGEEFTALVAELSLDTSAPDGLLTGGDGSCLISWYSVAADLAEVAVAAELGVPTGPVASSSGYSVIRVEERVAPRSVEELAANPMDFIDLNTAGNQYSTWASNGVRAAVVEVSPELGTWSSAGFGIIPPGQ